MNFIIRTILLIPSIIATIINIVVFTLNALIITIIFCLFKKNPIKYFKKSFNFIKKDIVYLLEFLF